MGDFCRIFEKEQKYNEMKGQIKNWTDATYEGIEIYRSGINGQVSCKLDGLSKSFFRNELLLVE